MRTEFFPDLFNLIGETQADQDKRQAAQAARVARLDTARQDARLRAEPRLLDDDRPAQNLACFCNQDDFTTTRSASKQIHPGDPTVKPMNTITIDPFTALVCLNFESKPNALVIRSLKELGYRWDAKTRRWMLTSPKSYTFDGPRFVPADGTTPAIKYALGAMKYPAADVDRLTADLMRQVATIQGTLAVRSMEDAQGING